MQNYNIKIYSNIIKYYIPEISNHDLVWLCNQAAKLYRNINDNCINNFRACLGSKMSDEYLKAYTAGCCGFSDIIVYNKETSNSFMIGFNYGH